MTTEASWREDRFGGYNEEGEAKIIDRGIHDQIWRRPYKRDVDRLKYTREFRRLKDVTQVARTGESYLYHDRLTHSLKVAQVGRNLAEILLRLSYLREKPNWDLEDNIREKSNRLARREGSISLELRKQLDPDAVEAACLAHDIGHPPFGHLAERTLDELLFEKTNPEYDRQSNQTPGGIDAKRAKNDKELKGLRFEGNAQAFRILTRLTAHRFAKTGLGLTVATLNGVLKYPNGRGESKADTLGQPDLCHDTFGQHEQEDNDQEYPEYNKFGYYETEEAAFDSVRSHLNDGRGRTLIAQIVDYADDVTYAVHDLTDFYKYGQIPLDRLLREAYYKEKWENSKASDGEDNKEVNDDDETSEDSFSTPEISGFKDYLDSENPGYDVSKVDDLFEYLSSVVKMLQGLKKTVQDLKMVVRDLKKIRSVMKTLRALFLSHMKAIQHNEWHWTHLLQKL